MINTLLIRSHFTKAWLAKRSPSPKGGKLNKRYGKNNSYFYWVLALIFSIFWAK